MSFHALGFGVATGLVVTTTITWMDWRLSPGGIFRDQESTNWPLVFETALGWFVPTLLFAIVLALPVTCWRSRYKNEEKKYASFVSALPGPDFLFVRRR